MRLGILNFFLVCGVFVYVCLCVRGYACVCARLCVGEQFHQNIFFWPKLMNIKFQMKQFCQLLSSSVWNFRLSNECVRLISTTVKPRLYKISLLILLPDSFLLSEEVLRSTKLRFSWTRNKYIFSYFWNMQITNDISYVIWEIYDHVYIQWFKEMWAHQYLWKPLS